MCIGLEFDVSMGIVASIINFPSSGAIQFLYDALVWGNFGATRLGLKF